MKNYEAILTALTRPCPTCGSASGEPCFTNTIKYSWAGQIELIEKSAKSKPTAPHAARRKG